MYFAASGHVRYKINSTTGFKHNGKKLIWHKSQLFGLFDACLALVGDASVLFGVAPVLWRRNCCIFKVLLPG